jgi:phosphoserine phosphatase RsbU/P
MRLSDDAGGVTACFANAGHPRPILVSADGEAREVGPTGTILGFTSDVEYTTTELLLEPGDTLFLYTDGVTEARRDGELFGEERLMAILAEGVADGASVPELARAPVEAASVFNQAHDDDMATLVMRVTA